MDNFLPPLPPGLDEVDLLAWVEGDPLPRNREVAVARLLSEHPSLARRLDGMRRDRDALRSLPADERAPAGLLDGVQAALQPLMERQMLLGLQDGEQLESHPPVSLVVPARRSVWSIVGGSTGRRFAMAAGLLLLVGGTTYLATTMFMLSSRPVPPVGPSGDDGMRIASNDARESATGVSSVDGPEVDDSPMMAMRAPEESVVPEEPAVAIAAADPEDATNNDGAMATASAMVDEAEESEGITLDRAVQLAQEKRLVIRLRMGEGLTPREGAERVANRLRRTGTGWRYAGEAPAALATAVVTPVMGPEPLRPRPAPEVMVGREELLPPGMFGPPAPISYMEMPPVRTTVYVVQSRLDSPSLDSLRTALAGVAADVVFEEADESLPTMDVGIHSLAPSAVLWWGQSPTGWTWWTSVPVVVEPRR